MKLLVYLATLLLLTSKLSAQVIEAKEAAANIGRYGYVDGQVYEIRKIANTKTTLIYIGDHPPKHQLAVIVKDNTVGLKYLKNYTYLLGEYARVRGTLIKYGGKPAIVLPNWEEVQTLDFKDESPKNYYKIRTELRQHLRQFVD
ncbi:hypothetical protein ABDD95_06670 [Mucilaginibacter sp. PAMB04274]|uniref:hypothetical protein n=1 Tax=Mucilaginibacter sp. PAMB04274 TaxID=3138568 RepID=UPI0031F686F6